PAPSCRWRSTVMTEIRTLRTAGTPPRREGSRVIRSMVGIVFLSFVTRWSRRPFEPRSLEPELQSAPLRGPPSPPARRERPDAGRRGSRLGARGQRRRPRRSPGTPAGRGRGDGGCWRPQRGAGRLGGGWTCSRVPPHWRLVLDL